MIVEADLADRDDFFILCEVAENVEVLRPVIRAVLGVNPDGGEDVRVLFREVDRPAGGGKVAAGVEDEADARVGKRGEERLAVRVERGIVVVRVGVKNQFHKF